MITLQSRSRSSSRPVGGCGGVCGVFVLFAQRSTFHFHKLACATRCHTLGQTPHIDSLHWVSGGQPRALVAVGRYTTCLLCNGLC